MHRDDQTPLENRTSIAELKANTAAMVELSEKVRDLLSWCTQHGVDHVEVGLRLDAVVKDLRETKQDLKAVVTTVQTLVRRRRWTVAKYAGAAVTAIGAFVGAVRWAVSTHDTYLLREAKAAAAALDTTALVGNQATIDRASQLAADRAAERVDALAHVRELEEKKATVRYEIMNGRK